MVSSGLPLTADITSTVHTRLASLGQGHRTAAWTRQETPSAHLLANETTQLRSSQCVQGNGSSSAQALHLSVSSDTCDAAQMSCCYGCRILRSVCVLLAGRVTVSPSLENLDPPEALRRHETRGLCHFLHPRLLQNGSFHSSLASLIPT